MTPEDTIAAIDQAKYGGMEQLERMGFKQIHIWGPNDKAVWIYVRQIGSPGPGWPRMLHILIQRRGQGKIGSTRFRIFQDIKNQIVGENCEAVEIYPAEDRLRDMADTYHLWGFADPNFRLPFGMQTRGVKGE